MSVSKRKILLVDQDPEYGTFIADRLRVFGYEVSTAKEVSEALIDAKERTPELVLLDFNHPEECFSFMKIFKRLYAQVPMIMVSEADDAPAIRDSFDRGATDYVVKPFELNLFLNKVKNALHP